MNRRIVRCQICREPMTPRPFAPDVGPNEWRPSGDRLAAILSEVFECPRCGGLTIRPGASPGASAPRPSRAA